MSLPTAKELQELGLYDPAAADAGLELGVGLDAKARAYLTVYRPQQGTLDEAAAVGPRRLGQARELALDPRGRLPELVRRLLFAQRPLAQKRHQVAPFHTLLALELPPRFDVIEFGTGVHSYWRTEDDLPIGVCPVVVKIWHEAIMNGYFDGEGER